MNHGERSHAHACVMAMAYISRYPSAYHRSATSYVSTCDGEGGDRVGSTEGHAATAHPLDQTASTYIRGQLMSKIYELTTTCRLRLPQPRNDDALLATCAYELTYVSTPKRISDAHMHARIDMDLLDFRCLKFLDYIYRERESIPYS